MNINDIMFRLKEFETMISFPCPAYLENNDPNHNGDMIYQEYGDEPPNGVKIEDLDYWNENDLIGFRLIKKMWRDHAEDEEKEILILEVYIEGGCPYYLQRFRWLGTEEDFNFFIERYEEASMRCNHLLMLLYNMFKDNKRFKS